MTDSQNNGTFRVLAACLLGAAMFAVLPSSVTMPIRDAIRLAISPGQRCVSLTFSVVTSEWQQVVSQELSSRDLEVDRLQAELAASQLRERRARLTAAAAADHLAMIEQQGATPFDTERAQRLIRPRAVRASVLGAEMLTELKSRGILDRGSADGVASDLWVLNQEFPVVQAGSELSVSDGLPVFAGRCVAGRIVEAGRWTSTLQYLTEPGFRARAVLVRPDHDDSQGQVFSFGAEGLIEGRSELKQNGLCELTQIPATEHVEVGMAVYSPPGHAVDAPMLFGRVVSAEVPSGGLHWIITVRPAVDLKTLRQVEIVVPVLEIDLPDEKHDDELILPTEVRELPLTQVEPQPRSASVDVERWRSERSMCCHEVFCLHDSRPARRWMVRSPGGISS